MSQILFEPVQNTQLFLPKNPAPDELLLFLRIGAAGPAGDLSLDQTWDKPADYGYYLFLDRMPADFTAFEANVKAKLPQEPPQASSFAWVDTSSNVQIPYLLRIGRDPQFAPWVAEDFAVLGPTGYLGLGIVFTTPIAPVKAGGFVQGFTLQYPAQPAFEGQPASQAPSGAGSSLPMTGSGVGCFRFQGLYSTSPGGDGNSVEKGLFDVSVDPLRLFDGSRSYMTPTGLRYRITKETAGFSIAPIYG